MLVEFCTQSNTSPQPLFLLAFLPVPSVYSSVTALLELLTQLPSPTLCTAAFLSPVPSCNSTTH